MSNCSLYPWQFFTTIIVYTMICYPVIAQTTDTLHTTWDLSPHAIFPAHIYYLSGIETISVSLAVYVYTQLGLSLKKQLYSHPASVINTPHWWAPIRVKQLPICSTSIFVWWLGRQWLVATNRTSCPPGHESVLLTWSGWHNTQRLLPLITLILGVV